MSCSGCAERRIVLGKAAAAARSGRVDIASEYAKAAVRSLSEDARAFARALRAKATR